MGFHTDAMLHKLNADTIREDGRIERHCKHGIGHTVGHVRGWIDNRYETIHGCDGCCKDYETQECKF